MNQIAKLVSGRLKARVAGPHPDADMLAAFAENALPAKDRSQLLQHLGDCAECREVLYLAMPDSPGAKQSSFFNFRRSRFALRWATAVASIAILAGALVANRRWSNAHRRSAELTTFSPGVPPARISENRVPEDLNKIGNAQVARNSSPPPVAKDRPAAKHMTARLQAPLDFEKSDQVRLSNPSAPSPLTLNADSSSQDLPINGRHFSRLAILGAPSTSNSNALQKTTEDPRLASNKPAVAGNKPAVAGNKKDDKNVMDLPRAMGGPIGSESYARGNLGGTIVDPSGAVVANAQVTMAGPSGVRIASSKSDGTFSFDRLAAGSYSVKAEADGFRVTEIKQVAVLDDKAPNLQVTLEPGAASETVEVSAASPAAGVGAGAQVATSQNQTQMSELKAKPGSGRIQGMAGKISGPGSQWTLTAAGTVQRSIDDGKTWQIVTVAPGAVFRALAAVGTHVWVGGSEGYLYHSADSGKTWTRVDLISDGSKLTAGITHIDFSDVLNGSVSTTAGQTWSTTDGGGTWRRK